VDGRIYISSAYLNVKKTDCGDSEDFLDNDPHFWKSPPTWGICRTDYRRTVNVGDFVFYVLPANAKLPQMIYAYMCVKEKINHWEAYNRPELINKRMGNKNPNGNIIVDGKNQYNRFDLGAHFDRFKEVRKYYVIGDARKSRKLQEPTIRRLAPDFVPVLRKVFRAKGAMPHDILTRKGRRLNEEQVRMLLEWLNNGH
jgi:hypothetical protein